VFGNVHKKHAVNSLTEFIREEFELLKNLGGEGMECFFRNGVLPASASIDVHNHFIKTKYSV
jgi:hypothetical protein